MRIRSARSVLLKPKQWEINLQEIAPKALSKKTLGHHPCRVASKYWLLPVRLAASRQIMRFLIVASKRVRQATPALIGPHYNYDSLALVLTLAPIANCHNLVSLDRTEATGVAPNLAGCETQLMMTTLKTRLSAVMLTIASSLAVVAQPVLAQEPPQRRDLTLSTGTSATLRLSALNEQPRGIIVMIHGWSSQKDEVGGLFKRQAEALAKQGMHSLRMDIRGESEREESGFRLTSTFDSRISDAMAGADWAAGAFPNLPIGLLGFSYGGATAMALIGRAPERYQSVVFWSTIINPSEIITDDPKGGPFRAAIEHGEGYVEDFARLTITREHVLGLIGYNPLEGLEHYSGALLSIRGSLDSVPLHDPRILKAAKQAAGEYRIIQGADHLFNVFDPGANFDLRLIRQTTRWFEDTL